MHLSEEPFRWIKEGRKTVEVRLYDEKRRNIEIGDIIVFRELGGNGEIRVRVRGLLRFGSFRDLFSLVPKRFLNHEGLSVGQQVERMREYYSEEKEKKYGVLGILFERVE